MKKKGLLILILTCLSLSITACQRDSSGDTEKTTAKTETTKKTTAKETQKSSNTSKNKKNTPILKGETTAPETEPVPTESSVSIPTDADAQCQYCGEWFSTIQDESGTSPYGRHVAQEGNNYDITENQQDSTAQCPYCGGWFSTVPQGDAWSAFDSHVLEEKQSQEY